MLAANEPQIGVIKPGVAVCVEFGFAVLFLPLSTDVCLKRVHQKNKTEGLGRTEKNKKSQPCHGRGRCLHREQKYLHDLPSDDDGCDLCHADARSL